MSSTATSIVEGLLEAEEPVRLKPVDIGDGERVAASDLLDGHTLTSYLETIEKDLIGRALQQANGVKAETARLLGIKPSALYYKLGKYGFMPAHETTQEQ
jgi:two-component system, NtrC family, response regulator HydG